jgi:hypothetical protein
LGQHPGLETNDRVKIFEGSISDVSLIASALSPRVDAAFCVLGINENTPAIRIAQDTAQAVVAALCLIDVNGKPPRLIFLSSVSLNRRISASEPAIANAIIKRAFSNLYADLALCGEILATL